MPQKHPPASVAISRAAGFASDAASALANSARYLPYPSASNRSAGTKRSEAELMQ